MILRSSGNMGAVTWKRRGDRQHKYRTHTVKSHKIKI